MAFLLRVGRWIRRFLFTSAWRIIARTARHLSCEERVSIFEGAGFALIPKSFYYSVPLDEDLTGEFLARVSDLPGVKIDTETAIHLATELQPLFRELSQVLPVSRGEGMENGLTMFNGSFMVVDAHMYYALVRHLRPSRIVEVGSGISTRIALAALRKNKEESGSPCHFTVVDPYPNEDVVGAMKNADAALLLHDKIQLVDPMVWMSLEDGDILFIDTSHVLAPGNDVHFEYLEILPRLRSGVWVHIHDISLPYQYPKCYASRQIYWTEQYLLQAFLAFNDEFEIMFPGNYLMHHEETQMRSFFPQLNLLRTYYPEAEPSSFWMRRKRRVD